MKLKIKEIDEKNKELSTITEISGFCILSLLAKRIFPDNQILDDNDIIDFAFSNADYDRNNNMSNELYIKYADEYINKIGYDIYG